MAMFANKVQWNEGWFHRKWAEGCVCPLLLFKSLSDVLLPCMSRCSSIRVHQGCQPSSNVS
jgi:hypothetical protein